MNALFLFETGSQHVAQANLKFAVFLCQSPGYWSYRQAPPCPA